MSQYSQIRRAGLPSIYVYTVPEDLPLVNITAGTIAFIESISGLFIYNNGWRPLSTSEDGPVITAAPLSITVESGTIYTATIEAYDPDELPIIYTATTTGNIAENTEVNIDEDTGVLTVLSNNPYNDNFSIILTASDGVFATTRTIPVTITNRLPVFTVEPAASLTTSPGVEFSYQYAVTDADDSTTLDFTVTQDLVTAFPNFQYIQRIKPDSAFGLTSGYSEYASTGGNYLVVPPWANIEDGIYVYKRNSSDQFKLFQTQIIINDPLQTNGPSFYATAVNDDFLYASQRNGSILYEKILKYDSDTDQFIEWLGGDLGSIDNSNRFSTSAQFCKTNNGDTALIIGYETDGLTDHIKVYIYDTVNDEWVNKISTGDDIRNLVFYSGDTITHSAPIPANGLARISHIQVNPIREYEIATISKPFQPPEIYTSAIFVWELNLDDNQGSVADNVYTLTPSIVAFGDTGLGADTRNAFDEPWEGVGIFFEDENTLWCAHRNGALFKVERGTAPDDGNNSYWVSNIVPGGTATITAYTTITGNYSVNPHDTYHYNDNLIMNGSIGSLGKYTFQLDNTLNTVQYISDIDYVRLISFDGRADLYRGSNTYSGDLKVIFNRDHNLVMNVKAFGTRNLPSYINIFGLGVNADVDTDGTVVAKSKSFGTYNIITNVSDSIDTISDTVSLEVPAGINFTQNPPTSKTIDANSIQSFDTDVVTSDYNKTAQLKVFSDIPHSYKTSISGATSMTVRGNDLVALVGNEVRVYTIDSFGDLSESYTVIDTTSVVNSYSEITDVYSTDDYIVLGRRGNTAAGSNAVQGQLGDSELSSSHRKTYYNQRWNTDTVSSYYRVIDLHQNDKNAKNFLSFDWDYNLTADRFDPTETRYFNWSITLKQYNPITNRTTQIGTPVSFTPASYSANDYHYPKFYKTYYKDYAGTAGTGKGWLAWWNNDSEDLSIYSFDYNETSIEPIQSRGNLSSGASYNQDQFFCDASSDGQNFATVYWSGSRARIWLYKGETNSVVENEQVAGSQDNYLSCGFVKVGGEYHLVTLLYHVSSQEYRIQLWDIDLVEVSSYTVLFTDSSSSDLQGPIASDDNNTIIVGNWIFSVSPLTNTWTHHLVMSSAESGITTQTFGADIMKVEYSADRQLWFVYASAAGMTGTTGNPEFGYSATRAFSMNPITKNVESVTSVINPKSSEFEFRHSTAINTKGEYLSSTWHRYGANFQYSVYNTFGLDFHAGNLFGKGSLLFYNKVDDAYQYHSAISTHETTSANDILPFGNKVGGILQKTDIVTDKNYLVFGYPWDAIKGKMYSYAYNSDTSSWDFIDDFQGFGWSASNNPVQYNNVGFSLAKYENFILEAGPRDITEDSVLQNYYNDNHLYVIADRSGELHGDQVFGPEGLNNYNRLTMYGNGYVETILANSYIAWANTGYRGNYPNEITAQLGPGKLFVWNTPSNNPANSLQETSKTSSTAFVKNDRHEVLPPLAFNNALRVEISSDEIQLFDPDDSDRALPFRPDGDYTIEFHYRSAEVGYGYILGANTFNGTNRIFGSGFLLYTRNSDLYFTNNEDNLQSGSSTQGVYWSGQAPSDNQWRHYAIVYDSVNQNHTLWVDGIRVSTQSYPANPKVWEEFNSTTYNWSIGMRRNGVSSTRRFEIANLIINFDAQYNPSDAEIDISVFGAGTVIDKISDNTWLAISCGPTYSDFSETHNYIRSGSVTFVDPPTTYTPLDINTGLWSKYINGNDNIIVTANDDTVFISSRKVNNKFYYEQHFVSPGINKVDVVDNEADTVVTLSDEGVNIYSRDLENYFISATSISNGSVTLYPKYLTSGSYNLSTMATDSVNVRIKNTAITQNPVLDLSSVTDRTVILEWGSTDTQTLPVSNEYTTTWSTQFTNPGNPSGQFQLSGNTLTVTPSNVSHDTFAANLIVSLSGETKTVANYKYQTYAPWKYGPADQFDYSTEDNLRGWRGLSPSLDGDDSNDQSYMYGRSVSLSEIDDPNTTGYLVVGQPRSNWDNTSSMTTRGEVYVYQWNDSNGLNDLAFVGSEHEQRLQNSITFGTDTNADGQHFGWVVDITPDGETILATAPGINTLSVDETQSFSGQAGAVIYTRQSDGTHAVSTSIDFADISLSDSQLGTAAAISDDASTIVFGSANYPLDGNQYGLVSIWRKDKSTGEYSSFSLIDHITNNWAAASNTGKSVAVSADGSVVVVGQPGDSDSVSGNVLVYKYTTGGYQLVQTLSQGEDGDKFGYSVAMTPDGGTIVVGSPGVYPLFGSSDGPGRFIVYDGDTTNGYTQTFVYTPEISTGGIVYGESIGTSVTIDKFGSTIIAGGPYTSGAPRTGGSRSVNNYQIGHVYTAYKTSGSWNKGPFYIPDAVDNYIRGSGTFASNSGWKNKTFGYSVALSPNGSHLAVGDPTLGGEVPYTTPEVVYTFTPAVIRLRQQILDLNPTLFNTSNINRNTGILVTINPITMGTGSPISIELPVDFWPTGIGSISDYSTNVFVGTGGVSVSLNSSTNSLEIAHTRNTSTVSAGYSFVALDLSFKTVSSNFVFEIRWQ